MCRKNRLMLQVLLASVFRGHFILEALRAMETTVIELVRAVQNDFEPPLLLFFLEPGENRRFDEGRGWGSRSGIDYPPHRPRTQTVGRIQTIIGIIAEEMRESGAFRNSNFKTFPRARACAIWKVGGWIVGENKWPGNKQVGSGKS